jgi:hypothetical protein
VVIKATEKLFGSMFFCCVLLLWLIYSLTVLFALDTLASVCLLAGVFWITCACSFLLLHSVNFFQYQLSSEQVVKHINLEDYISSKVPSLKACSNQKSNGELKSSSLKLLASIMQFLQRLVVNITIICNFYG